MPEATAMLSYRDLYQRWEANNWSAIEIDFTQDRADWQRLSTFEQQAALWNYALFFHGEDAVTDGLSPYIAAAPLEEQKYFLATQQADEARHAIFFHRFLSEVVGIDGSVSQVLAATDRQLTWGFRQVFKQLERMVIRLHQDRTPETLAAAVCLYHLIVEATLAQPGQNFIEEYLRQRQILPGFLAGMEQVARDEQRHIGFGVLLLSDLQKAYPETVPVTVARILRQVGPWLSLVFAPPEWDERYVTIFGSSLEDISTASVISLTTKLRAAGLAPESLPGGVPMGGPLAPRELARVSLRLAKSGIINPQVRQPATDSDTVELFMHQLAQGMSGRYRGPELTWQWQLQEAGDWWLGLQAGQVSLHQGQITAPDLRLKSSLRAAADLTTGYRSLPYQLSHTRLRLSGSPRALWAIRGL